MTRRRRRKYRPRVRDASAPLILASAGYGYSLAHLAGFLALGAVAAAVWPLAVLSVSVLPAAFPGCLATRRARVRHRKRRADAGQGRGRAGYIPRWMRLAVWRADRWRCVACGRPAGHTDHADPFACGGLTWLPNLFGLCAQCNLLKSCYYPPWDGYDPVRMPILLAERRARRNLLRWLRMAWVL